MPFVNKLLTNLTSFELLRRICSWLSSQFVLKCCKFYVTVVYWDNICQLYNLYSSSSSNVTFLSHDRVIISELELHVAQEHSNFGSCYLAVCESWHVKCSLNINQVRENSQ